jgi:tetratricopeptide (TPR) repeat protein
MARRGLPLWFDDGMYGTMKDHGWRELMLGQADKFIRTGRRDLAIELAWQCWRAGDADGGAEILGLARNAAPDGERNAMRMAAAKYFVHTRQWARAEQELDEALADRSLAAVPQLWRAAGRIAAQQGKITKAVLCDERALGLEYRGWNRLLDQDRRRDDDAARRGVGGPGQGDADRLADLSLPTIRAQHQAMLDRYAAVAQALASSQARPDRELVAGVIRTADRWRSLDGDERAACNAAAKALRRLGAQDLAWEYLTTPLAGGPTEPKAWTALAGELAREGAGDLADRAYATAVDLDPANPQTLLDRAGFLQQRGNWPLAKELYQQIVQGRWAENYRTVQEEAERMLRR